MLSRAPRALHHALSPKSAKNDRLPLDTPRTLVRRERLGMLVGSGALPVEPLGHAPRPAARPRSPTWSRSTTTAGVAVDLPAVELREASGA